MFVVVPVVPVVPVENVNVLLTAIVAVWLNVNTKVVLLKEITVVPTGIVVPLVDDVTINPGIISGFDNVNVTLVELFVAVVVVAVVPFEKVKVLLTAIVALWLNVNSLLLSKEITVVPTGIPVPVTINPGIISGFDNVNVTVGKFVVAVVVVAVVPELITFAKLVSSYDVANKPLLVVVVYFSILLLL